MVKIVGTSTFKYTVASSVTYSSKSSSGTLNAIFYVCPADGNVFQLEPGDRKRKYCSTKCRYKMRKGNQGITPPYLNT